MFLKMNKIQVHHNIFSFIVVSFSMCATCRSVVYIIKVSTKNKNGAKKTF